MPSLSSAQSLRAEVHQGIKSQTSLHVQRGWIRVRIVFSYDSKNYTAIMSVNPEVYNKYSHRQRPVSDPSESGGYSTSAMKLSAEGKDDILPLAKALYKASPSKKPEVLAAFILSFVQSLPYEIDALTSISDEIWRNPLQTLVDKNVDCEDSSILFTSLMAAVDQNSALIIVPGHMLTAVAGNFKGDSTIYEGKKYFFSETTSIGWPIGKLPSQINIKDIRWIYSVDAYKSGIRRPKRYGKALSPNKSRLTPARVNRAPAFSEISGGTVYIIVMLFIFGFGAWFAWDYGWFSSSKENDSINDDYDSW